MGIHLRSALPAHLRTGRAGDGSSEEWRRGRGGNRSVNLNNETMFLNLSILNLFSFLSQRAELTSDKDMYLDNSSIEDASGVYPIDDDDYASASGSGKAAFTVISILHACSLSPSLLLSLSPLPLPTPTCPS